MSKDDSLGSLFGKAKKWAQQELKNAVSPTGDPVRNRQAEEANEQLGRQIEQDAEQMRDDAITSAFTPQALKDYQAVNAANRAEKEANDAADARVDRAGRAGISSVELSGFLTGCAAGLAVGITEAEESCDLYVSVECVDPAPMIGGTVRGFCFMIPDFHGDDVYPLPDRDDFDSLQYELYLVEESEGWAFHPSYGPGTITVAQGVADVRLVLGGAGSETIQLRGSIVLEHSAQVNPSTAAPSLDSAS